MWLPAGASAFNVVLVKRFFDNLPREIFEAAQVDGAGPFRLFWSIVLPMSQADPRRRLGVRGHRVVEGLPLAVAGAHRPDKQPLSVRLPRSSPQTDLGVFLAALLIAALIPIVGFLVFQRMFLRGAGSAARSRADSLRQRLVRRRAVSRPG